MNKFSICYPVKPLSINQGFGANPQDYAKFMDSQGNPLKGHDGVDLFTVHGTPIYATHDGMAHYEKDSHGGEGIAIRTTTPFDYPVPGGQAYFITMYWHIIGDTDPAFKSPIPMDGKEYPVKTGDLIAYADNTGAPYESSGTHLHLGLFPVDANNVTYNPGNSFSGRIDPQLFFNGIFAQNYVAWYNKELDLLALLKKLVELYKSIKNTK